MQLTLPDLSAESDPMAEDESKTGGADTGARRIKLTYVFMTARLPMMRMMQAALVRNVAFAMFSTNPRGFETHPANASLTWHALESLEGSCIVQLVENFRRPLVKPHVPASVHEKLDRLVGHRHRVSCS